MKSTPRYYITAKGDVNEIDLPDELVDKIYQQIKSKYHDLLTIVQGDMKVFVVIYVDGNNIDALTKFNKDVRLPWRGDAEWGVWNAEEDDFWAKIKKLDDFFEKYRHVTTIKIYPKAVIPSGSYDFFERMGRSNCHFSDIVKIVQTVAADHKNTPPSPPSVPPPAGTPPQKPPTPPNTNLTAQGSKKPGQPRKKIYDWFSERNQEYKKNGQSRTIKQLAEEFNRLTAKERADLLDGAINSSNRIEIPDDPQKLKKWRDNIYSALRRR